jgi:pyruvate dehydrogenase E2 component (dihydrolipoamide acetyltransferase)
MIQKITLPKLGETVETSTIEKWLKKEGDAVAVGDILCEITTDKATLEVESYHRGTLLKIVAPTGKELPVGTLIAIMGGPGEKIPDEVLAEAAAAAPASKAAPAAAQAPTGPMSAAERPAGGPVVASPRARRLAKELGVAIEKVKGTGPGGRIVEADVEAAAKAAPSVKATPLARKVAAMKGVDLAAVQGAGHAGKVLKEDVLRAAAGPQHEAPKAAPGQVIPLSPMRRIIAERMLESKRTIPCYYLEMDADMTDLAALRTKLNAGRKDGKITFNDFVLKACGLALRAFPVVNSRWVEGGIERRSEASVGLAVSLDEGLIVPVVRDLDRKPLRQISQEAADLVERARSRKLKPAEYQGGCMTLTNLGMYSVRNFIPIINLGESAILGLGVIEDRVVCQQGCMRIRQIMTLTLAMDHRLVDGAVGAQFLEMIRDLLEAPQKWVE